MSQLPRPILEFLLGEIPLGMFTLFFSVIVPVASLLDVTLSNW